MPRYEIHDVPLIPQALNCACWYASAQMLIAWRRQRKLSCEVRHPDPSDVPALKKLFAANDGLPWAQTHAFARDLGLEPVPPMTPTPEALASWLALYGPIWFQGLVPGGHTVVITGIDDRVVEINDPWPPNIGARRRIAYRDFGEILQPMPVPPHGLAEAIEQLLGTREAPLAPNLLYFPD